MQPTEFQPQVFLSGFDLDEEGEIKELVFFQNEEKNIPCRIYNSPPFEVVVDWEFMTFSGVNDTILETGNITFPANALENRNPKSKLVEFSVCSIARNHL